MVWIVILLIIVIIILIKFNSSIVKDNQELSKEPLQYKFQYLFKDLIDIIYQGNGDIRVIDDRALNVFSHGALQIVQVFYSTGHLTLTWRKRDFYRGEVVFEKQYNNVRSISLQQQKEIAQNFVFEANIYFKSKGL